MSEYELWAEGFFDADKNSKGFQSLAGSIRFALVMNIAGNFTKSPSSR